MSLLKPYSPPKQKRTGLSIVVEGPEKVGKTQLGLQGRRELAYMGTDRPPDYLLRKRSKGVLVGDYRLKTPDLNLPADKLQALCTPLRDAFFQDFYTALSTATIRSIVVDSASIVWDIVRLAEFGKLTQVLPVHYARVNSKMQRLTASALAVDKDVIWISRLGDEWKRGKDKDGRETSEATGKLVRDGWKSLGFETEATVRLSLTDKYVYKAVITASAYAGLGEEFEDDEIRLSSIKAAIFGEEAAA